MSKSKIRELDISPTVLTIQGQKFFESQLKYAIQRKSGAVIFLDTLDDLHKNILITTLEDRGL